MELQNKIYEIIEKHLNQEVRDRETDDGTVAFPHTYYLEQAAVEINEMFSDELDAMEAKAGDTIRRFI